MKKIDNDIKIIDNVICRHISNSSKNSRGVISQDILSQLRNFLEHIMLKIYSNGDDIENTYDNICKSIKYVKGRGDCNFLNRFHKYLKIVASHYTLDEENSERLMLKYYDYLLETKNYLKTNYNMEVLANLDDFPIYIDESLNEYYTKISEKIEKYQTNNSVDSDKYYIEKIKPFYLNSKVYYEVTFTQANDYSNKAERVIAFTKIKLSDNYACKFKLVNDNIEIVGKNMPIIIISGWEIAIRECEFINFNSIILGKKVKVSYKEQKNICNFLTKTGFNLCEIVDLPKDEYKKYITSLKNNVRSTNFLNVLDKCRRIIDNNSPGEITLRYLLFNMNNVIIRKQRQEVPNNNLSKLYLKNGCIPFDTMPFINSLIDHNPRIMDLFDCISTEDREHELLARFIKNNTEIRGMLFTTERDLTNAGYNNISEMVDKYNNLLWIGHREEGKLVRENGQIFINGYKNDTCFIINKLKELSSSGIQNYEASVSVWLDDAGSGVDCPEKREVMKNMFTQSKVAVVYGSAGVGKSTLINHVSNFFAEKSKLFLAQTNPAVDNLKRKITSANCMFSTVASFLTRQAVRSDYDLLVIDECSTISNKDMKQVLEKASFQLILLVGDTYQIKSIRYGNWFSFTKKFISDSAVFELSKPYRTKNNQLLTLWSRVRCMDDRIKELIARQGYSASLDSSIFSPSDEDEIILCLNYDGLYGINNINRFLQESNPNTSFKWGIQQYKIGDPVLFNDCDRFYPVIYNNMKGKIVGIQVFNDDNGERIQFDIELNKVINGLDALGYDFELLENSEKAKSIIRFFVYKNKSLDEDDSNNSRTVVPFQVAYAVSIHKAQGLEYDSVKIVISDDTDELITHNIFYTAITRTKNKLKIYWTPEVEQKVLERIKPQDIRKDSGIIKKYLDLQT